MIYPVHICVTPSVDGVGLIEYFCTHPIYICGFLQRKIRTSLLKTSSRGCVRTPTLPVVLALCKMLLLARYSEPELDPMWVVLWCITVPFYFLLSFVSSVRLLGGLYGDVPSDVINVYQPPGTDIYITFSLYLCGDASGGIRAIGWP